MNGSSPEIQAVDLFSGPGGLTLGMKAAGITPLCSVELRPDAVATYKSHTPDCDHYCRDIREVDLKKYRGAAALLYGGPPCQPFSTGGLRKGSKDTRDMLPAFLAAVETVVPDAVVMENVPGLIVQSRIHYLHDALASLRRMGYLPSWRILNASHYGVPQNRRRLFVVALKTRVFCFPKPTHGPDASLPLVPTSAVVSLTAPLGNPPDCPVVYAKYPDLRPSPYAGQVYNGGGRPIDLAKPCHTILASAGGHKTHWVDTQSVATAYHKHLTEGGEPWKGTVLGARRLTLEESALIQTFPRSLKFAGPRSSQYKQVGDAVPPLLAEHLARAIVRQMQGENPDAATHLPSMESPQLLWQS